jgi:membrane protein
MMALPTRGWLEIALAVLQGVSRDRIFLIAAGVAFYEILALFPAIGAMVSIYGLFANPNSIAGHLDTLAGLAPAGAVDVLRDQLTRLAHQDRGTLGFGFAVGLAVALYSANAGMSALFNGLDAIYEEKEQRGLAQFYMTTMAFTAAAIVLVLLSLGILVMLPLVLAHIRNARVTAVLLPVVRWPILFVFAASVLAVVYRYGACRSRPQWRNILASGVVAAAIWLGAAALFSWYVAEFGRFNATYGSLGAIFGFMTWLWVSMVVILLGAKLDAELQRRTRH